MSLLRSNLRVLTITAAVVSAPAAGQDSPHADEPIGTVREVYDGRLYPDVQVNTFRNIDRLFPTRIVRAGEARELPIEPMDLADFRFADLEVHRKHRAV